MTRYSLTPGGLIVLESSTSHGRCKTLVTGNRALIRELLHTANLALEHRAAVKAAREDSTLAVL